MFIFCDYINDDLLFILKANQWKTLQYISLLICFECDAGDRQNTYFSRGSGTQTASRFSSTSCRGSSYFFFCWPWWRPSLGRPPVPACRTSTGTPPIQCKSLLLFLPSSLCAVSLPCNYLLSHRTRLAHRLERPDDLETPRSMLLYKRVRAYSAASLRGRIPKARAVSLFHHKNWRDSKTLFWYIHIYIYTKIATILRQAMRTKTYSHHWDNIVTLLWNSLQWLWRNCSQCR